MAPTKSTSLRDLARAVLARWREDPVLFAHEALGISQIWHRQAELLRALVLHEKVAVRSGQKTSKALALDTPVPTPNGWTTMGNIKPGDRVFDEKGVPCLVTDTSEVFHGRECFDVEFDDGTVITTDADHLWLTSDASARRAELRADEPRCKPRHVTTREIATTVASKNRGWNHTIPVTAIHCGEDVDLPIPPYVLGAWLGDGTSARGDITNMDQEVWDTIRALGYESYSEKPAGKAVTRSLRRVGGETLTKELRRLGLILPGSACRARYNKHVPAPYFRASERQRRELLAGLIDTDGSADTHGRISFTNTNRLLVDAVFDLAAGLGYKPVVHDERRATINGRDCGAYYAVSFQAHDRGLFKIARKDERLRRPSVRASVVHRRAIVAVRPTASVPVRCITVDSESHLFLVSRSYIATHNTYSLAILAIWWALTRPRSLVILLAPSQHHLEHVLWGEITRLRKESLDRSTTDSSGNPRRPPIAPLGGDCSVSAMSGWEFPNGSKIIGFVTSDAQRIRGISGADNLYILDESTAISDAVWQSVDGNLAGGGRVLAVSNPVTSVGWYAAAFGDLSTWHPIAISSIEASEIDPPIKGLATRRFIENKRIEWGEDSPEWYSKVLGKFPPAGADGVIPRSLVTAAQKRWTKRPTSSDQLYIGVDPASKGRDSTAIVWRRGSWASEPVILKGEDTYAIVTAVVEIIERERLPNEKAHVNVDGVNNGIGVYDRLRHEHSGICTVSNLESSLSSPDPSCSRMRDALWMNLRKWLDTGAIHSDVALADDITAPQLGYDPKLKYKVEDKLSMRKRIGRSTDRADALALSVYQAPIKTWSASVSSRSSPRAY